MKNLNDILFSPKDSYLVVNGTLSILLSSETNFAIGLSGPVSPFKSGKPDNDIRWPGDWDKVKGKMKNKYLHPEIADYLLQQIGEPFIEVYNIILSMDSVEYIDWVDQLVETHGWILNHPNNQSILVSLSYFDEN